MNNWQGKVIWITGASSGLGEALAYEYAILGAKLILSARREQELERVKLNCQTEVLCIPFDLEVNDQFDVLAKHAIDYFGKIDVLINNGGISQRSEAIDTGLDIDRKIMEVNFFGNIALTKAVLPYMQAQQSGHIVPISSLAGKFGFYLRSTYSASKHALHGYYESLRLELEKDNIQITIICPAFVLTNISINALDKKGNKTNTLDTKQKNGMTAEVCAKKIIHSIHKKKKEVLIGNGEQIIVYIKRFFPALFYFIIKKQNPK